MRTEKAIERWEADTASALDMSAQAYWHDLELYPPSMQEQRLKELRHAAEKLPHGGSARLLHSLEKQGYL